MIAIIEGICEKFDIHINKIQKQGNKQQSSQSTPHCKKKASRRDQMRV
jgi:hypothetical protein